MQRLLTTLLLLGLASITHAAATATLDRTHINALDTLTLTLEVDDRVDQRPDLSALEQDFRILGSKRTLISSHSSAGREVRTRWQITLRPRANGPLTIPPLHLAEQITPALPLVVSDISPAVSGRPGTAAFFDTLSDRRDVYAEGQLLYTARLFHLDPLPESAIIQPPSARDADVREIGERRQYEGDYRGDPYLITEQQYAIFPHRPGPLTVEGARLQLPPQGEHSVIELQGEPLDVEVLAPAYQSSNGHWLPAQRLTLEESWNPPPSLQPGDRLQREITLTVTGVPVTLLPALMPTDVDGLYIEVESVDLTESMSPFGLVSTRREMISIEPLGTGTFTLPPVDLHWWDVDLDRGRHAALPSHPFTVSAPPLVEGEEALDTPDPAPAQASDNRLLIGLLTLVAVISSLGWLYTSARLRRYRVSNSALKLEEEKRRRRKLLQTNERAERNTFQALAIACQQNNAGLAKVRLIEWGQNFWPDQGIDSLEAICDAACNQTLDVLILDLEQHLHDSADLWRGDLLLQSIDTLRQRRQQQDAAPHNPELAQAS